MRYGRRDNVEGRWDSERKCLKSRDFEDVGGLNDILEFVGVKTNWRRKNSCKIARARCFQEITIGYDYWTTGILEELRAKKRTNVERIRINKHKNLRLKINDGWRVKNWKDDRWCRAREKR